MREMEQEKIKKILLSIKNIEKTNLELEQIISSLNISSRNGILKEISLDLLAKSSIFKELQKTDKVMLVGKGEMESLLQENLIEEIILRIQNSPSKRVLYLKEFLDMFAEIGDSDKEVLINTLKDEDIEILGDKMLSLLGMFKIKT